MDLLLISCKSNLKVAHSTKRGACRAQDLKDAGVGDESGFAMESDGVDAVGRVVSAGHGSEGLLDLGPMPNDGTEVWVCCLMLRL